MNYDAVMLDILKEIFSMGEHSKNRWYCFTMDIKENCCHLSRFMLISISVLRHFQIVGNKYKDFSSVS